MTTLILVALGCGGGSPSKREAMFKGKDLLESVTGTCAITCAATMSSEAKCK